MSFSPDGEGRGSRSGSASRSGSQRSGRRIGRASKRRSAKTSPQKDKKKAAIKVEEPQKVETASMKRDKKEAMINRL